MSIKRRKATLTALAIFLALLAVYAFSLKFHRNAHYAKVFHQFGKDCLERPCSLKKKTYLAEKAVYHDPEFSGGYSVLGELSMEKGEAAAAVAFHEKALGLDLRNERSLLALGVYYFHQDDLARSLRYLNQFNSFWNQSYGLNYYLGRAHERLGDAAKAVDFYQKAHSLDTANDMRAYARLGAFEARAGDIKAAFAYAKDIRDKGREELAKALESYTQSPTSEFMPMEEKDLR
jgi:tetratricopeptide (TPR) repeat protein